MPFALVLIGLALIISGAKDTHEELGKTLAGDFTGDQNFTKWAAAIGGVGAVGYVKALQPVSRIFLALIFLVMVLSNGGLFQKFVEALNKGPEAIPRPADNAAAGGATTPMPINSTNPLDWIKWGNDQNKSGLLFPNLPGASWLQDRGSDARQNFSTFMDKIVPMATKLLGIPGF